MFNNYNGILSKDYKGEIISKDTLRLEDLLKNFVDFLDNDEVLKEVFNKDTHLHSEILEEINYVKMKIRLMELTDELDYMDEYEEYEEDAANLLDELIEILNIIAPEGSYFGTMEGNGSTFGFFNQEESW